MVWIDATINDSDNDIRTVKSIHRAERWYVFGIYCLIAAVGVVYLHHLGY
jgi:hypothetical protein